MSYIWKSLSILVFQNKCGPSVELCFSLIHWFLENGLLRTTSQLPRNLLEMQIRVHYPKSLEAFSVSPMHLEARKTIASLGRGLSLGSRLHRICPCEDFSE